MMCRQATAKSLLQNSKGNSWKWWEVLQLAWCSSEASGFAPTRISFQHHSIMFRCSSAENALTSKAYGGKYDMSLGNTKNYRHTAQNLSFDLILTTGVGRTMSSQWQKKGSQVGDKMFSPGRHNKGLQNTGLHNDTAYQRCDNMWNIKIKTVMFHFPFCTAVPLCILKVFPWKSHPKQ